MSMTHNKKSVALHMKCRRFFIVSHLPDAGAFCPED